MPTPPRRDKSTGMASTSDQDLGPSYRLEVYRKLIHLLGLLIPLSIYWLGKQPVLSVLGAGVLFGLGLELVRRRVPRVNHAITRWFGFLMREEEQSMKDASPWFTGATWMAVSAFVTFLVFPLPIATGAFALAVVGDSAAALVGRRWGQHFIGVQRKTWEGSCAFLGAGLLAVGLVPGLSFAVGAAGAVAATFTEALLPSLNDNITIPLSSGGIMLLLAYLPL